VVFAAELSILLVVIVRVVVIVFIRIGIGGNVVVIAVVSPVMQQALDWNGNCSCGFLDHAIDRLVNVVEHLENRAVRTTAHTCTRTQRACVRA
jgi:cellobiose-specific phosphotransferase system component IIC